MTRRAVNGQLLTLFWSPAAPLDPDSLHSCPTKRSLRLLFDFTIVGLDCWAPLALFALYN